jgi:hypothetical protein
MANANVIGKALYLEFRNDGLTQQVLFTPEGITTSGKYVPLTTYRRRISALAPRKAWRQMSTAFRSETDPITNKLVPLGKEHASATIPDRVGYTDGLFAQLLNSSWQLHVKPITVEVTSDDLEDVRLGKTPYKILARITRSRRALNFGEALYA